MNKVMLTFLSLLCAAGLAFGKAPKNDVTGTFAPKSGSKLSGTYTLAQDGKSVKLKITVAGAPEGELAVHVHENPDCSDPEGKKAGGHWNPTSMPHGQWGHGMFHMGDIGNMKDGKDGTGEITFSTDNWTMGGDAKTDVLGHSIIVHEKVDDFKTQPTGNAGGRIGCAVIPAAGKQP